jgi:hypothetical protein
MRLVSAILAAVLACGVAEAQLATTPKPAPKPPEVKLPEIPAGQWDDSLLKGAPIQLFDGKEYAAVEFERLQQHVDSICHYDRAASIIGKPVATIAGYRQNMGWPALVDGRQVDIIKEIDESKHADKLVMPFMLVDVTRFLDDVRTDDYFKACGGLNFKVCTVAVYGRLRYVEAKTIPDWVADLTVGDKKCVFEVEHYRKMGVADYGEAVNKMAVDAFYKGMTQPPVAAPKPRP